MGIRVKAGGTIRDFPLDGDPKGHPINWELYKNPSFSTPSPLRTVLPSARGEHNLNEQTNLLASLVSMSASNSIAVTRAARLYQDAIWIIESEPHLSWVLLVSAIEIAAASWYSEEYDELELLREFKPDLVEFLERIGSQEAALKVANEFAQYIGSSKKFRKFIVEFMPDPPTNRPREPFRVSWKNKDMKTAMVRIYDHRSRALHDGIPFPYPMCEPPRMGEEKPSGLATKAYGGVWVVKDTPMLLHIFEYIVRNSLLKWWESMSLNKGG